MKTSVPAMALLTVLAIALCGCGNTGASKATHHGGNLPAAQKVTLAIASGIPNLVVSSADGASTPLTVYVLDAGTNLPVSGMPVSTFSSTGTVIEPETISDSNGVVRSAVSVPANSQLGAVEVTAFANDSQASLSIPIVNLSALLLSPSPAALQCSGSSPAVAAIRTTAINSQSNPLSDVSVAFQADNGTVDPQAVTDSNGHASSTVSVPFGSTANTVTVKAQSSGVTNQTTLQVTGCAQAANASPTPGSGAPSVLTFVSANPTQLGILQSALPQQSTITFKLTDASGAPLPNVTVNFFVTSISGERVSPVSAVTTGDGTVQTVLTSGRRATVVQVTASTNSVAATSPSISIVGGFPVQGGIVLTPHFRNIAGAVTAGISDPVTVLMTDRFSNPIEPGTAISLEASNGGSANAPNPSDNSGQVAGTLTSTGNPIVDLNGSPTGGTVVVLAMMRGETPFIDSNNNGVFDSGETVITVPEPFFDLNGNGVRDSNEPFVDVNGNGVYDSSQNNGQFSQNVTVFASTRVTFSGATLASLTPSSGFVVPNGSFQSFTLSLADQFNNPLTSGTTWKVTSEPAGTVIGGSGTVPDAQTFGKSVGAQNQFTFTVQDSDSANSATPITLTVTINSPPSTSAPGGNGDTSFQVNGTMN